MGQGATQYAAALGIERILLEYTDKDNPLTISEIESRLSKDFGMNVSGDAIRRKILPQIREFGEKPPHPSQSALNPGWTIKALQSQDGVPTVRYYADERLFNDYQIGYLLDALNSMAFTNTKDRQELIDRVRSFRSEKARSNNEEATAAKHRTFITPSKEAGQSDNALLRQAIKEKRTISFDYLQFGVKQAGSTSRYNPTTNERNKRNRFEGYSPYRLELINGSYYLLINWRNKPSKTNKFRILKVALIQNLEIDEDGEFMPADEDAVREYFRAAIDSFGGTPDNIKLRCSEKAIGYVIEKFANYSNFRIHKKAADDWYEVEFSACPDGLAFWALKYLSDVEVVSPKRVRNTIVKMVREDNPYLSDDGEH